MDVIDYPSPAARSYDHTAVRKNPSSRPRSPVGPRANHHRWLRWPRIRSRRPNSVRERRPYPAGVARVLALGTSVGFSKRQRKLPSVLLFRIAGPNERQRPLSSRPSKISVTRIPARGVAFLRGTSIEHRRGDSSRVSELCLHAVRSSDASGCHGLLFSVSRPL